MMKNPKFVYFPNPYGFQMYVMGADSSKSNVTKTVEHISSCLEVDESQAASYLGDAFGSGACVMIGNNRSCIMCINMEELHAVDENTIYGLIAHEAQHVVECIRDSAYGARLDNFDSETHAYLLQQIIVNAAPVVLKWHEQALTKYLRKVEEVGQ